VVTCVRCLRQHPGGEASCKSKDKTCRRCGLVGHYAEIHDVTDPTVRQAIADTLGEDVLTPPAVAAAAAAAVSPKYQYDESSNGFGDPVEQEDLYEVAVKTAKRGRGAGGGRGWAGGGTVPRGNKAGTGANLEPLKTPAWKKNSRNDDWYNA
jgi:hypothetical protein